MGRVIAALLFIAILSIFAFQRAKSTDLKKGIDTPCLLNYTV